MTRRPGDAIAIGDRIVVKVMEIKGGKVQIGIEAPKDVKVTATGAQDRPQTGEK